jgi:hypothetical protein
MGSSRLAVLVYGKCLPEAEARAMWTRMSAHLDTHRGDFEGFAKSEGFVSARTETRDGQAVLVLSTTEAAAAPVMSAAREKPPAAKSSHKRKARRR